MSKCASEQPWWRDKFVRDYALASGLMVASGDRATNVSVTLQPSVFPEELFHQALSVQTSFNLVVDAMSRDMGFLQEVFDKVMKTDRFIARLFDIYQESYRQGNVQTTSLGIHRADYMVDLGPPSEGHEIPHLSLKQVEINTFASSYGGLESHMKNFHEYIRARYSLSDESYELPDNPCLQEITDGIALAWREYSNPKAEVLMVVAEGETNIFDQRYIEFDIFERHKIKVMRRTLQQVYQEARLSPNRELFIESTEVAVVYYRCGYAPSQYPTEGEWSARRTLELSRATNCPSVAYQLAGFKKVQQVLSLPGQLEKFCSDQKAVDAMRATFAGQYSLEMTSKGEEVIRKALSNPHRYVMKPQREGGGNNVFGEAIRTLLHNIGSSQERESYILMDFINSPSIPSFFLKSGDEFAKEMSVCCELGVFGIYLRKGDEVVVNKQGGYLMRTKPAWEDEGGVSIGVASLDNPRLVSKETYIQMATSQQS